MAEGFEGFSGDCYLQLFRGNVVQIATVLLRKECLMKVGGFDERIRRASCEDYDLWFRIARHFELAFIDFPWPSTAFIQQMLLSRRLGMLEAELYVVRKALSNDVELQARIGRREVRDRVFELYVSIGYLYHDRSTSTEARYFLSEALRHRWTDPYVWARYLANRFPPSYVRALRSMKRAMASLGKRSLSRSGETCSSPPIS